MPKKLGYKWEQVVTIENCTDAVREMLKGKRKRAVYASIHTPDKAKIRRIIAKRSRKRRGWNGVEHYREHVEEIGRRIANDLANGTWTPSPYREKMIFDELRQKWRNLKVPCLYDQCVHHAIMRVTEPDIMARKYYYDCGSVPGAGQSRAVDAIRRQMARKRPPKYVLVADIEGFFNNCQAEAVMFALRRIYKDRRFLAMHEKILSSMGGRLAIGFYPSPWYGNLVLCTIMDRFIKQDRLRDARYVRYVDDIYVAHNNKRKLHRLRLAISEHLAMFALNLKGNWQIYPTKRRSVAYLSYRFFQGYTLVRKPIMYRITRCARSTKQGLTPRKAMAMMSYKGILLRCDSYRLRVTRVYPYTNFKKCRRMISYVSRTGRAIATAGAV